MTRRVVIRNRLRRMWLPRAMPAAFCLIGVAGISMFAWWNWDFEPLDGWMPNIVTGLVAIAVTITLVEGILLREARERHSTLLGPVIGHISGEFDLFIQAVASDYATTHLKTTFKPLPNDPLELLRLWLAEQDDADLPHVGLDPDDPDDANLREMGYEFARQVAWQEEQLGDTMDPRFRAALRAFARTIRRADVAQQRASIVAGMPSEVAAWMDPERLSYRTFVSGACALLEVLRVYSSAPVLYTVDPVVIEWAEAARQRALANRNRPTPGASVPEPESGTLSR